MRMTRPCAVLRAENWLNTVGLFGAMLSCLVSSNANAQSETNLMALRGLAPVTALSNTLQGSAALAANYTVTGGIQTGVIRQPTLLPFPEQQQQALRDAFITGANLAQLSDGLGTTLGSAYIARAHYIDRVRFTKLSQSVQDVIIYAISVAGLDSHSAKFFFADETTDGKTPVSDAAKAILADIKGKPDMFGRSYNLPAGAAGADTYGNSRPFQTEPRFEAIVGPDYFNVPADNNVYNRGAMMNLVNSPSYPSGHATYGYTGALVLAMLIPDRYQQMVARAAEYGNDRIIVGAHYAMDVMGGRTLALYDMAHLLANDPAYMGRTVRGSPAIKDFRAAIRSARSEMTSALEAACGNPIDVCAREDTGRLNNPAANEAFYASTHTYKLPVVYESNANTVEDVGKLAPEAGYLLTVAFPRLSLEEADHILTETEGPGGGFLDDGSPFGLYSRLNLYAAAGRAAAVVAAHSSGSATRK